jgi:hypothetical protein
MVLFENFDISILNDPEFKEDSVREEIIAPILKKLGYSVSGSNKIIRSRSLVHPYVAIGSKQNKINIVPDYILEIDGSVEVVIDAKSPNIELQNTKHAEQVYSYAIHPEVRATLYALCNGKEWIIWEIDRFEPILKININEIINDFHKLEKFLKPTNVLNPIQRNYLRDYGLTFLKMGIPYDITQHFAFIDINYIGKTEDNLYSLNTHIDADNESLMVTFDMDKKQYLELLQMFPKNTQKIIEDALSRQPYYAFGFEPIIVTIKGKFGKLQHGRDEDFVPVIVEEITQFKEFS